MAREGWHLKEAKRSLLNKVKKKILDKTDDKSTAVATGKINKKDNIEPYLMFYIR